MPLDVFHYYRRCCFDATKCTLTSRHYFASTAKWQYTMGRTATVAFASFDAFHTAKAFAFFAADYAVLLLIVFVVRTIRLTSTAAVRFLLPRQIFHALMSLPSSPYFFEWLTPNMLVTNKVLLPPLRHCRYYFDYRQPVYRHA